MPFPFEIPFAKVRADLETYVDAVFGALRSEFLSMPKGEGFIEYPVFEQGYESLKRATGSFCRVSAEPILAAVYATPISLIVLRSMLGFTPSEWAYATTMESKIEVSQGAARSLDRSIRCNPLKPLHDRGGLRDKRIAAMVTVACALLNVGPPEQPAGVLHRLDKADTKHGPLSLEPLADIGVPYAMLLYERFLGRPFAAHRDSVSELVGDVLESAIEAGLVSAGVSFRKTKRAQRVTGFDQAPDFIVPDEFHPRVVIEAKITEDDGTARDKITRVQHLSSLSTKGLAAGKRPRFEVVACIAGRGFKVRREDMKKLLLATRGKVFTLQHINRLVDCTGIRSFRTR